MRLYGRAGRNPSRLSAFAAMNAHSTRGIARIAGTYHAWRGDKGAGSYVKAEAVEDDDEPF